MSLARDNPKTPMVKGDIAIIGMACLLPGAPDLDTYWQNIVSKVDAVTDPPPESWDADVFYAPDSSADDRVYCKRGGFISPLAFFNPLEHGVMPRAVEGGEPDQWLALQVARAALTDAGYGDDIPGGDRTAVILGKGTYLNRGNLSVVQHGQVVHQTLEILKTLHPEYTEADLQLIREQLKQQLPPFSADTAPGLIPNIIAGRIANRLNLMGPSYTVDAACASSLIAVDIAMRTLLTHQCDLALVGGAHVVTPVPVQMLFCQLNALSRREQIRPFDKNADGTILGEGIGMVVLKRLEDAQWDGNRIYAVIKGVGTSSDGLGMSVTAPRLEGEVLAVQRAYEMADISPRTIGLIEAHGTGTPVGDATEVKALSQVFGLRDGTLPRVALGSVKSMIAHTMPAAGIAGLIKVALALHHKVLPPTLNVDEPDPELELEKTSLYINTETRPWIHGAHDRPRRAGVNAFGFGGINAHVILEEAPRADATTFQSRHLHWDTEVCVLAAESRLALIQRVEQLQHFLRAGPEVHLKDLAYTLNVSLGDASFRLAIVATTLDDLQDKLDRAWERLSDDQCHQIKDVQGIYFFEQPLAATGQLAFLFPGEGSQYTNMLNDLCLHFPEVREHFDLIDRIFSKHGRNYVPSDYLFPRPAFSEVESKRAEERIWQMEGAVEAVLIANRALFELLRRLEIHPNAVVGHSTGEYSAMLASGMMDLGQETLVERFSMELNQLYRQASADDSISRATLVAVAAAAENVLPIVEENGADIYVAMDNCPHQTVIAGEEHAVEKAIEQLRLHGLIYEKLAFDRAYHTPLFKTYAEQLQPFLAGWIAYPPQIRTYSCTTMSLFTSDVAHNQRVAVEHWLRPVKFRKTIETMYSDGVRIFVEVGAGGNLTSFVNDILRGKPHLAVPVNLRSRSGVTQLNHLVGMLAAQAIPMRLDYLYRYRSPHTLDLERPDHPQGRGMKSSLRMKLATGWPPMNISQETAARLHSKSQPTPVGPSVPQGQAPFPATAQAGIREPVTGDALAPPASAAATAGVAGAPTDAHAGQLTTAPRQSQPQLGSAARVMAAHFQTMNQFLSVQQDVMQTFLTGQVAAPLSPGSTAPATDSPAASPDETRVPPAAATAPAPIHPTPASPAPATNEDGQADVAVPGAVTAEALDADAIRDVLLQLVSDRTGYPVEMLDLNLDLEAHLGIDSIKRVEIIGSFQRQTGLLRSEDMEALSGRKTLQEVIDFLVEQLDPASSPEPRPVVEIGRETSSPKPGPLPSLPLIGTVVSLEPGEELVATYQLDLEKDLFMRDHTLGRQISLTDPELRGLPILPLTMGMEMLAEGASLLVPGQHLVEMRDVRAYRWIALDTDMLRLELVAQRRPSAAGGEVYAYVREAGDGAGNEAGPETGQKAGDTNEANAPSAAPILEGTLIFADTRPEPPLAGEFTLRAERPSSWAPERLYQDGMFHGPAFQGVLSMDRIGEDGAQATLLVKPAHELFHADPTPSLVTDAVLLDQPGQVVAFWMAERLDTGYVIFPFHLESLHLYKARPQASQEAKCRARISLVGDRGVRSDLDVVGADERLWLRLVGWEDRRFDMPDLFFRFLLAPQDVMLSQSWPAPVFSLPESAGFQAYRLGVDSFPEGFFDAHGAIWRRVLAHLILSRRERELWHSLKTPAPRRLEWLLGRMVAKDAVRQHLQQFHDLVLCPADIEILPDVHGRPLLGGSWTGQVPVVPVLSIGHTDGVAVAVTGAGAEGRGVGVDIEHLGRMQEEVAALAFTPQERRLLAALDDAPQDVETEEWQLRLWCAKESVAKALGYGLVSGPQALVAQAFDDATGQIQIDLAGALARHMKKTNGGSTLTAFTLREGDWVVATCVYDQGNNQDEGSVREVSIDDQNA